MKRKKFVKQLLSCGVSRNEAEQLAKIVQALGADYSKALGDFLNLRAIRATNAWFRCRALWQTAEKNMWVGVLVNE